MYKKSKAYYVAPLFFLAFALLIFQAPGKSQAFDITIDVAPNTLNLESQGTVGLMVPVIVAGLVGLVVASAPQVFIQGTSGIFVEALAVKLRAAMTHVDGLSVAALALDRSDPIELGHLSGALETFPIGAEGDQQAGSQAGASSWQTTKDGGVGMGVHGGLDLVI